LNKHVDALTKLPDRKQMELSFKEWIKGEESVGIALLDIDHFKEVNDVHGSDIGDEVLVQISNLLQEHSPGMAFRVSGDEFAIGMPGFSLEQAFLHMEQLRVKVANHEGYSLPDGTKFTITIGVAQYPRDAKEYTALNQAADAALMAAKEGGRNQVALPPNEEMVMKSCYYSPTSLRRLKNLAEQSKKKESVLLREALEDVLRKYDKK
jgi:diguanylate cyclase